MPSPSLDFRHVRTAPAMFYSDRPTRWFTNDRVTDVFGPFARQEVPDARARPFFIARKKHPDVVGLGRLQGRERCGDGAFRVGCTEPDDAIARDDARPRIHGPATVCRDRIDVRVDHRAWFAPTRQHLSTCSRVGFVARNLHDEHFVRAAIAERSLQRATDGGFIPARVVRRMADQFGEQLGDIHGRILAQAVLSWENFSRRAAAFVGYAKVITESYEGPGLPLRDTRRPWFLP